jgi:hypothetical protein
MVLFHVAPGALLGGGGRVGVAMVEGSVGVCHISLGIRS